MAEKGERNSTHVCRHERRQRRWDGADAREKARATRTPSQQLAKLDERLGKGQGAARERERLS